MTGILVYDQSHLSISAGFPRGGALAPPIPGFRGPASMGDESCGLSTSTGQKIPHSPLVFFNKQSSNTRSPRTRDSVIILGGSELRKKVPPVLARTAICGRINSESGAVHP